MKAAEYEGLRRMACRTRAGDRLVTYWTDAGTVYVKSFPRDGHTHMDKVTEEQWENAVVNHGIYEIGEEPQ